MVTSFEIIGYFPGVLGKVTTLHAVYYKEHWGLDQSFEAQVSRELADFIEKRFLSSPRKQTEQTALLINGVRIPLKDWVQEALAGTVSGFVNSLKLNEKVQEIELRIRLQGDKE